MNEQIKKDSELLQRWQCMFTAEEVSMINKLLEAQARITAYETERRVRDCYKKCRAPLSMSYDYMKGFEAGSKYLKDLILSKPKTNEN